MHLFFKSYTCKGKKIQETAQEVAGVISETDICFVTEFFSLILVYLSQGFCDYNKMVKW